MPKLRNLVLLGIGLAAGRSIYRAYNGELWLREHPKGLPMMAFEVFMTALRGARRSARRFGVGTLSAGPLGVSSAPEVGGLREHDGSFARDEALIGDEGVIGASESEYGAAGYPEGRDQDEGIGPDEPLGVEDLGAAAPGASEATEPMYVSSDSYDLEANVVAEELPSDDLASDDVMRESIAIERDEVHGRTIFAAAADDDLDSDVLVGEGMDRSVIGPDELGIHERGGATYTGDEENAVRNEADDPELGVGGGGLYTAGDEDELARTPADERGLAHAGGPMERSDDDDYEDEARARLALEREAPSYGSVSPEVLEAASSDDEYSDLAGDVWPRPEPREVPPVVPPEEPK